MRKTCIVLIVLAALLSMLTACGKQTDTPAGASKSEVQDETNVALTLELGSDWSISEDSNCIVQMDGSNVIVDLSEEVPVIILKADAMDTTRCYHLTVE